MSSRPQFAWIPAARVWQRERSHIDDRLPPSLLDAVAAHGNSRSFRAQTILLNEGDPGGSLYIVLEGRLRAYASSPEGRDVVLSEHGPGEYVGELSLDGSADRRR